jgi:hypothetical protein
MYILAHLSLLLYQWAHFGRGPSKYLLQLCSVSGLLRWLVRWLQNQHCVARHQQPPRNIMHSPLPHVTCNATIKPLVIFNDKASSRPYVLDLYLQLHLLIPASRLHTCRALSTVTPSNARRIHLTKGLRHEIPQIFCAKSTSSDFRPIRLVLFLFLVKSKSVRGSSCCFHMGRVIFPDKTTSGFHPALS